MISHHNMQSNLESLTETWAWKHEYTLLHALPLYHVHGLLVGLQLAVYNGSTLIWSKSFDPNDVIAKLNYASVFMGVPTYYVRLLGSAGFSRACCENMRLFISGSAPL